MPLKCEDYEQICVIGITGDLSGENAAAVRKAVEQHIDERQVVDFVLDLEKCPFVDSEGLDTLLWIKRKCEDLFGQLKLIGPDESIRKILEITRLEHQFECHAELSAALKTMR